MSLNIVRLRKLRNPYLMWVVNTAVICSLLLSLTNCSPNNRGTENLEKEKLLRIGVESPLLSFDPLSPNSLGERDLIDLLSDQVLAVKEGAFEMNPHIGNFSLLKRQRNIIFKFKHLEFRKDFIQTVKNTNYSNLWKYTASKFSFSKKGSTLLFKKERHFISSLLTYIPLLRFNGVQFGAYKIGEHKKGSHLILNKNKNWLLEKKRNFSRIKAKRIKSTRSGLSLLQAKVIDVFVPQSEIHHSLQKEYLELDYKVSPQNSRHLSLYSSYKNFNTKKRGVLSNLFCLASPEVKKTLGPNWKLVIEHCKEDKKKSSKFKNLTVISNTSKVFNIFDIISVRYKNLTGKKITYKHLKGSELTETLKKGSFDYYLSEEVVNPNWPVPFESYHSKGIYNTLKVENDHVDNMLDSMAHETSLKAYMKKSNDLREKITHILPIMFRFKSKVVTLVCKKSTAFCKHHTLKEVVFD